jgi:hypothetical protein
MIDATPKDHLVVVLLDAYLVGSYFALYLLLTLMVVSNHHVKVPPLAIHS